MMILGFFWLPVWYGFVVGYNVFLELKYDDDDDDDDDDDGVSRHRLKTSSVCVCLGFCVIVNMNTPQLSAGHMNVSKRSYEITDLRAGRNPTISVR